jgi:hypothetical protein
MKKLLVSIVFVLSIALPVMGQESTEVPTVDVPTIEVATQTPDVVTATPSPTEEATEEPLPPPTEPGPIISDQVNFRVGIFGILTIIGMLFLSGFGIGAIWGNIRANKEAKDALEKAYESLSPEAQEQIRLAHEQTQTAWDTVDRLVREVLKFGGEVTDHLPNATPPNDFRGNVTRPASNPPPGQPSHT